MTTLDPQTLAEFAREAVRSHAQDIERMSVGEMMSGDPRFDEVTEDEFDDVQAAIYDQAKAYAKALSWPAEQPTVEQDGDSAADRVRKTANRRLADGYKTADYDDEDVMAVLDNREQWRNLALSRGAKRAEQDGDVRAVDRAIRTLTLVWSGEAPFEDIATARAELIKHFEVSIARLDADTLDARDADGSAS